MKTALTIAGSDSSGGAGIQADLKTFSAFGIFGMSAITAITAQNTCGVTDIRELDGAIVAAQIRAVFDDIQVDAVKIGMLASGRIIEEVALNLAKYKPKHIVLDPVMVSKSGSHLLKEEAIEALIEKLIPMADVVTPNLDEAAALVGYPVKDIAAMEKAAADIVSMGARSVVVKGGHLPEDACDLFFDGTKSVILENKRIDTIHTHGTGCTYSSAIASGLARGNDILTAIKEAKQYITTAITHGFRLGKGIGPTHHFYDLYRKAGIE